MAEFNYGQEQIARIVQQAETMFRRRFMEAVQQIRDTVTLEELERLLALRQFDEALVQAEVAATNLSNAYVQAYVLAAEDVLGFVSNSVGITIRFDQVNARAVTDMRRASLRMIAEFTSGQRAATRLALVQGIRSGLNPAAQAREFRQSIGLTARQVQAVANYRRLLETGSAAALQRELRDRRFDGSIRRAVSGEKPLTTEQVDRMVQRYYERSLAERAITIARTEALPAVHRGGDEAFRQAVEAGVVEDLEQTWHTANDGRVRHPSHTAMDGQKRPLGEPFLSGNGNLLFHPGDGPAEDAIRCRCVKTTQFAAVAVAA